MVVSNNQQGTSKTFVLDIGGVDFLTPGDSQAYVPVNEFPITWTEEVGGGVGSMNVTIYDPEPLWADRAPVRTGMNAELKWVKDGVGHVLFGGTVVGISWRKAIVGRYADLRIVSYDAWLDWLIVPRLANKRDTSNGKTVRWNKHDDSIIKRMFGPNNRRGPITDNGGYIERTTHASDEDKQLSKGFRVDGVTLRGALEEIAEEANYDQVPRLFYVDYAKRLHYYKLREDSNPAPFRATSAEYAAMVTSHANIREYWPMTEADPSDDVYGRLGVLDLETSAATYRGERLVPNQPGYARRTDSASQITSGAGAGAALTCSGGWAYEVWVKPSDIASSHSYVMLGFGATVDGPQIRINTAGAVVLTNREDVSGSATASGVIEAGKRYHLVVGQRPGPSLLTNGGFDSDLSGWTVNDSSSSVWSGTLGPDGGPCVQTNGDGSGSEYVSQVVPVTAGQTYTLSADIWQSASGVAMVGLTFRDAGSGYLSGLGPMTPVGVSTWERKSVSGTAPAGAVEAVVNFYIPAGSTEEARAANITLWDWDDVENYIYRNGIEQSWSVDATTPCLDGWDTLSIVNNNGTWDFDGDVAHAAWYTGDGLTEAEARENYLAGIAIIPEDHRFDEDGESETHAVYVRGKNAKGSGWVSWGPGNWEAHKQQYIARKWSDTEGKRNRAGKNFLRKQEDTYSGSFVITDPEHAHGWRAGQTVYVDDDGLGFPASQNYRDGTSRQPYEVAAVSGELAGGNAVRLTIEYGILKRTLLRRLR